MQNDSWKKEVVPELLSYVAFKHMKQVMGFKFSAPERFL